MSSWSSVREEWLLVDTADTFSVSLGDSNITTFTPAGTPGVLDNPVAVTIANNEDTVVQVGSTGTGVNNSTSVGLEDSLVGFNGNWNGSNVHCSLELTVVVSLDLPDLGCSNEGLTSVVSAVLSAGLISIGVFTLEWVASGVLESANHGATVATTILKIAINELLLREWEKLTGSDGVMSFKGTGGWESPAWSTLSLVLHFADSVSASPI